MLLFGAHQVHLAEHTIYMVSSQLDIHMQICIYIHVCLLPIYMYASQASLSLVTIAVDFLHVIKGA